MRTVKIIIILFTVLSASLTSFGQSHDELFKTEGGNELVKSVVLFPNPAVEVLNIKFENPCAKRVKLAVHNIIGNSVEVEVEAVDDHEIQIKVHDLPTGYYLLSLQDHDSNLKSTYKFLKR